MYVRMKIGARKGEVVDVKHALGLELIRDEKAERVEFDPESPAPPPALEIAVTPNVAASPKESSAKKDAKKDELTKGRSRPGARAR